MPEILKNITMLIGAILLSGCAGPFSHMELAGQVVDITTGQPVPDTYVSISQSGQHPLSDMAHAIQGPTYFGWGLTKTDKHGNFHYETPLRISFLMNRRATVYWYHPCYRSPTNSLSNYGFLGIYESAQSRPANHKDRYLYGSKQKNLSLKVWPESSALAYNDGAEYDPEYATRRGLRLTGRGYYLGNVGVYSKQANENLLEMEVASAIFGLDREFSLALDHKYYFKDPDVKPTQPIPASEPRSYFDCSKPIAPQLPAVLEKTKDEYILKHKAEILEALKALEAESSKKDQSGKGSQQ
jgi:hypothetical protein